VRRDVDAVVTAEPVRAEIMSLGGVELFSSASLPLELVGVAIISGRYLEQQGQRASAFCTAWRRAEAELRTSADARAWMAEHMRITPEALTSMLDVVRLVSPSESDTLLGPPRPRLMATTARIQSFLIESDLLSQTLALDPLFRWPVDVDQAACRG
jgi:ABC-type nitrate/sulfonate/bicarbonate transport system substrate-binding protein